jgi:predicted secreted Zn-dependent protease
MTAAEIYELGSGKAAGKTTSDVKETGMHWLTRWVGPLLVLVVGLAGPAMAELRYTTVYKDHLVHGTTPGELYPDMIAHPIMDPDDGPAFANITHDHTLAVKTATVGGACKVTDLSFSWSFVITLPKAADEARMSAATGSLWREFVAKCRWHEEHRIAIFLDCGKAFVDKAEAMTGTAGCLGLDGAVRRYVDAQYTACMKKQRAFGQQDAPHIANLGLLKATRETR